MIVVVHEALKISEFLLVDNPPGVAVLVLDEGFLGEY
jgi:hypothetical protein